MTPKVLRTPTAEMSRSATDLDAGAPTPAFETLGSTDLSVRRTDAIMEIAVETAVRSI